MFGLKALSRAPSSRVWVLFLCLPCVYSLVNTLVGHYLVTAGKMCVPTNEVANDQFLVNFPAQNSSIGVGDWVEADWGMNGRLYSGTATKVTSDNITVQYFDDLSFETLPTHFVAAHNYGTYKIQASAPAIKRKQIHACYVKNETFYVPMTAPFFIIIGTQKSGSSSLFRYLLDHPDAVPPRNLIRNNSTETHFFDLHMPRRDSSRWQTDDEYYCHVRRVYTTTEFQYDRLMQNVLAGAKERQLFSFEKTPKYITDAVRLPKIFRAVLPWTKVVVTLRDPVERAYSQFNMEGESKDSVNSAQTFHDLVLNDLSQMAEVGLLVALPRDGTIYRPNMNLTVKEENKAFSKVCELTVARGLYDVQLRQWLQMYPLNSNLFLLDFASLSGKPHIVQESYNDLMDGLGLRRHVLQEHLMIAHNDGRYDAPMFNSTRELLANFYRPYNDRLADLVGDTWRGKWQ